MLILVRHGRTAANAAGLLLGRLDVGLDAEGVRQATALGAQLAVEASGGDHEPASRPRVVASPLLRTRQTAAHLGRAVSLDERWIELDYGTWDGRPLHDVPPEAWAAWRRDPGFAPEGGESLAALGTRVRAACDDLAAEAAERDVIVVTHVSPLKAAVGWALGLDDEAAWRLFVSPASITRIRTGGPAPTLVSFNETLHLTLRPDGEPSRG